MQQGKASVAVYHLECELLAAACHDPGAVMEQQLVLPLLQQRIAAAAAAAAQQQAENQIASQVSRKCWMHSLTGSSCSNAAYAR